MLEKDRHIEEIEEEKCTVHDCKYNSSQECIYPGGGCIYGDGDMDDVMEIEDYY